MDVAEVLAPASNRGPEAQTQSDQVVDVESAESSPADPVEVAQAIGLPTEIDAPLTEDSGEALIDLVNLTLKELIELKVIPKVDSSHGPPVDLTTRSLAQLMRTKVLGDVTSDTEPPADLLVHSLDDLLRVQVMSGGSTSFDGPSFEDLIGMSLSGLQGVRVASEPISSDPADDDSAATMIVALGGGANFTPFESMSESTAGALTATSPLGDTTSPSSFSSVPSSRSNQGPVTPVNDAPTTDTVAASGLEDAASIAVTLTGSDIDGTVQSFALSSLPANGTLYTDAALTILAATATDYAATGESLTLYFVPDPDWNGATSFDYAAKDDSGASDVTPATATITVTGSNDAPTANDDTGATDEDTVLNVAVAGVLANDTDPDTSDSLSVSAFDAVSAKGAAVTVAADGSYSYDPTGSATLNALAAGESTTDTFTYTVSDGTVTDTATVTITVSGSNDAPVITVEVGDADSAIIAETNATLVASDTLTV
ncbi:MAG: Ig-like domain-containing protein, partial [Gemmatimonadales bacterium]